jgi:hypothetical protein
LLIMYAKHPRILSINLRSFSPVASPHLASLMG